MINVKASISLAIIIFTLNVYSAFFDLKQTTAVCVNTLSYNCEVSASFYLDRSSYQHNELSTPSTFSQEKTGISTFFFRNPIANENPLYKHTAGIIWIFGLSMIIIAMLIKIRDKIIN